MPLQFVDLSAGLADLRLARDQTADRFRANLNWFVSTPQFGRVLKRSLGAGFRELTVRHRLRHAMEMLQSSDLPVKQISFEAGYESVSSFCRSFRRHIGITPLTFRANYTRDLRDR